MRDLKVWMRVGDCDDYHDFDSLDEAVEDLLESLDGFYSIRRSPHSGISGIEILGTSLVGENAVSLYWGDDDAQLVSALSDFDIEIVQSIIDD